MFIKKESLPCSLLPPNPYPFQSERNGFLNIETTGLSATSNFIMMASFAILTPDSFEMTYLIAQNSRDEEALLQYLIEFFKSDIPIYTFGSHRFSLPFFQTRFANYRDENLSFINDTRFIDIQEHIRPYKSFFPFKQIKRQAIEEFLLVHNKQFLNGKKLIKYYHEWEKASQTSNLDALYLHLKNDLLILYELSAILTYIDIWKNSSTDIVDFALSSQFLQVHMTLPFAVPKPLSYRCYESDIYIHDQELSLAIPVIHDTLKYFLPGSYKDYYYLPVEDYAIHQSLASFVDNAYKKKATASTCYTKKTGDFLQVYDSSICPVFKISYTDHKLWVLLDEQLLNPSSKSFHTILHHLIIKPNTTR